MLQKTSYTILLFLFILIFSTVKEVFAQNNTVRTSRDFRVINNLRIGLTPSRTPSLPTNERFIYVRPTLPPTLSFINFPTKLPQNKYINMAINDLSKRLSVESDKIAVVEVQPKDFGDTSLGCPKPHMFYLQVITPGYLITLSYEGILYIYHAGLNSVVYC